MIKNESYPGGKGSSGTYQNIINQIPEHDVYIEPFLGAGEFYQEYGDFQITLTVPAEYLVAATGTLDNAEEVLTTPQRERLVLASRSENAVAIVTRDEALAARGRKMFAELRCTNCHDDVDVAPESRTSAPDSSGTDSRTRSWQQRRLSRSRTE